MQIYYIQGMNCNGCVRKVTSLIMSISGVNYVQINLVTSKAILDSNREITFEEISQSLSETNFKLTTTAPSFVYVFRKWLKEFFPFVFVFAIIISWTLVRQMLLGWSVHFAMHDFMGSFFLVFGGLKVLNWRNFAESYKTYDPLAAALPVYAYIYPAIEVFLGASYQFRLGNESMLNLVTILIMSISIVGIVKVLKKGEMVKCACLGGYFNIPITWFTVFENTLMILMAVYAQFL